MSAFFNALIILYVSFISSYLLNIKIFVLGSSTANFSNLLYLGFFASLKYVLTVIAFISVQSLQIMSIICCLLYLPSAIKLYIAPRTPLTVFLLSTVVIINHSLSFSFLGLKNYYRALLLMRAVS